MNDADVLASGGASIPRRVKLSRRVAFAAQGATFGALFGIGLSELLPWSSQGMMLIFASVGAMVAFTALRRFAWAAAAILVSAVLVVGYTPLVRPLLRQLERRDLPGRAPAVVVLGALAHRDGTIGSGMQDRLLAGYAVLVRGDAPTLVLTRPAAPAPSWDLAAREQMRDLGLHFPVEVVGPVRNTHDEAVAVSELARQRGWGQVILVTHPWHMRRAAAAFEKAGVKVICVPCVESQYDLGTFDTAGDRLAAFRFWVHETGGYLWYKLRGWV